MRRILCLFTLMALLPGWPAAQAQAPATEATQPPPVVITPGASATDDEECNLACRIRRIGLTPGGGGGITAGKEILTKEVDGLELGIQRPAAEQLEKQLPTWQ